MAPVSIQLLGLTLVSCVTLLFHCHPTSSPVSAVSSVPYPSSASSSLLLRVFASVSLSCLPVTCWFLCLCACLSVAPFLSDQRILLAGPVTSLLSCKLSQWLLLAHGVNNTYTPLAWLLGPCWIWPLAALLTHRLCLPSPLLPVPALTV